MVQPTKATKVLFLPMASFVDIIVFYGEADKLLSNARTGECCLMFAEREVRISVVIHRKHCTIFVVELSRCLDVLGIRVDGCVASVEMLLSWDMELGWWCLTMEVGTWAWVREAAEATEVVPSVGAGSWIGKWGRWKSVGCDAISQCCWQLVISTMLSFILCSLAYPMLLSILWYFISSTVKGVVWPRHPPPRFLPISLFVYSTALYTYTAVALC